MDENLKKSLLAFENALKTIDKERLDQIIDQIDKIENSTEEFGILNYFNSVQHEFERIYGMEIFHDVINVDIYDQISSINNNYIPDTKAKFNNSNREIIYNISINGNELDQNYDVVNTDTDALAA
ncbi:hypothetical protein CMT56_15035 [Elizabethkingia anophelis]|nr:hypothetical protein [Elizabethkingia anophelis]MDV3861094.1 hypothetical protein [Elizabethkingia anophelis]MDV3909517.1 hypothetical protein [Elizabethkingia anophelis]MDV3924307.1 hypothetical protein [Elizabethkingia anophelis]MDV3989330.1 hypothetical protein [Elizabethkingia anophelis]